MTQPTMLTLGMNYPLQDCTQYSDGAIAEFLREGNTLLVVANNLNMQEIDALTEGDVYCGVLYKNGCLIITVQFHDKNDNALFTFDAPFDSRLIPSIKLPNINNDAERLGVNIHIVDTSTNTLKGLRFITLSAKTTLDLFKAVQEQLSSVVPFNVQYAEWLKKEPYQLFNMSNPLQMG